MKINELKTREDLANLLNIKLKDLTFVLYIKKPNNFYNSFQIPKKDGSYRTIDAPSGKLKLILKNLNIELSKFIQILKQDNKLNSNISHGFEKDKNIITNAKIHKNKNFVINIDLEDFFNSFHFGRVKGFFEKNNYFNLSEDIAIMLAQLTCYNGKLPQGSPASPIITNLICQILDYRLLKISKKFNLDYTRYADDLTFSTNYGDFPESYDLFLKEITKEIEKFGLKINNKKTRIRDRNTNQTVTGLVVNKKVNYSIKYYRTTRAMLETVLKSDEFSINKVSGNIEQLNGRFSFLLNIHKYNESTNTEKNQTTPFNFKGLKKQYQLFLFYKYFYNVDQPTIFTEGPTDILYLKAALKSLFKDFPTLVEKVDENKFNYKINFLHRNRVLKDYFNISYDGADTLKNVYFLYTDKGDLPNIYSKILSKRKTKPMYPLILFFDNEIESKRPLKSFISILKDKDFHTNNIIKNKFSNLINDGNLFLMTHQLIDTKKECEIEDLFNTSTLNITINGKSFSRETDKETNKYFGKKIFASYVFDNYQTIDFTEFKDVLANIDKIIKEYKGNY